MQAYSFAFTIRQVDFHALPLPCTCTYHCGNELKSKKAEEAWEQGYLHDMLSHNTPTQLTFH